MIKHEMKQTLNINCSLESVWTCFCSITVPCDLLLLSLNSRIQGGKKIIYNTTEILWAASYWLLYWFPSLMISMCHLPALIESLTRFDYLDEPQSESSLIWIHCHSVSVFWGLLHFASNLVLVNSMLLSCYRGQWGVS